MISGEWEGRSLSQWQDEYGHVTLDPPIADGSGRIYFMISYWEGKTLPFEENREC